MKIAVISVLALVCVKLSVTMSEELEPAKCYIQIPCPNDATQDRLDEQADRLTALETLVIKLVNSMMDEVNPESNEPQPTGTPSTVSNQTIHCPEPTSAAPVTNATCEKGMTEPGLEPRIPVQVLDSHEALCDTETDGGGWIVMQRRTKGDVDFLRGWEDYKRGFGNITTDYWLGLETIHQLTSSGQYELRVDMTYNGNNYYAQYSTFQLGPESSNYKLTVGGYSGNAGDALAYHNNRPFYTYDHGGSTCPGTYDGAWWYYNCYHSNLNGLWAKTDYSGLGWEGVVRPGSVTSSEMKIRRV